MPEYNTALEVAGVGALFASRFNKDKAAELLDGMILLAIMIESAPEVCGPFTLLLAKESREAFGAPTMPEGAIADIRDFMERRADQEAP